MTLGGVLGIAGIGLPLVEVGIALSVVVLGAAIAVRPRISTIAAMALVGFFAIFHGHAHGAEMPDSVLWLRLWPWLRAGDRGSPRARYLLGSDHWPLPLEAWATNDAGQRLRDRHRWRSPGFEASVESAT